MSTTDQPATAAGPVNGAAPAPTRNPGSASTLGTLTAPPARPVSSAEPTRTMSGFDEFTDVVDYIEKSTSWIWDHKNPGLIYRFYTPLTVVHTSDGTTFGRDTVIENTIKKMAAFPDIRDYVQDTIWAGNDRDGYQTSMRWFWTARNTGHSIYGPATGRRVTCSGIANCIVGGEQIVEEWVVYNEISLLRQLGIGVDAYLASLHADGVTAPDASGEVDRLLGQDGPDALPPAVSGPTGGFDVEDFVRRSIHDIWNRRLVGEVDRYYAPGVVCHSASDRELYGVGDIKQDIFARMAMLPDCRMHLDEIYWNIDAGDRTRVATRWTLVGTHTGQSRYGRPSGRRVRILGITHQRIERGRIVEEWTEFSELNLLKQIHLPLRPNDVDGYA